MKPMISDENLWKAVVKELESDPEIAARHITVTAVDGAITLRGRVTTYHEKHVAVRAAERVSAVRAVADEIEVRDPSVHERSDDEIAEEIAHLRDRVAESHDAVAVQVSDGRVILHGQVDTAAQRDAIDAAARHLTGVRAVSDLIEVKPQADPDVSEIERRVKEAIADAPELDADSIRVTMNNGVAQLHGHLSSLEALQTALHAAETAPGVSAVKSEIVVTIQEGV